MAIPVSALKGDNVIAPSAHMHWYHGPTLLGHLETVEIGRAGDARPFRFPVQWVNRPDHDFRGYAGTVASGTVKAGDEVVIHPSGKRAHIARIVTADGDLDEAHAGDAVTLTFAEEVDVSRGDMIALPDAPPSAADQIAAYVVWFDEEQMLPGRTYLLKCGCQTTTATVSSLKYKLNVDNLDHVAGKTLELNDDRRLQPDHRQGARVRPLRGEPRDRQLHPDRPLHQRHGGRRHDRVRSAPRDQYPVAGALCRQGWRAPQLKHQNPCVLWFTGLSGAGKSTIANTLEKRLHALGRHTYMLDGDNIRHGLNKDLGFTDADRVENIRRVAETARLFVDAGLIVMVSFISPFRSERRMARDLFGEGEFIEVFVDTPLALCELRDPKGLYRKARAGLIRNFTGIDSAYEPPSMPSLRSIRANRARTRLPSASSPSSGAGTLFDRRKSVGRNRRFPPIWFPRIGGCGPPQTSPTAFCPRD